MKLIVLAALLAVLLLQGTDADAVKKPNLRCHFCNTPSSCKKHAEVECSSRHDTCQKAYVPIINPSGNENRNNYYAATSEGIMVLERLCTTMKACQRQAKKTPGGRTTTCCQGDGCNA